jgi:hypothetical protein
MINKSTNIAEILESVDSIVSNDEYYNYGERKINNKNKKFANKKIDMRFNQDTEKNIIKAEKVHDDKKIGKKLLEPLILLNEFKEGNIGATERKKLEDENNTEELNSNPAYEIKSLKNSNTQQDEKIKDLNILLNKFKSQERYSDLNKVITLYQKDNAVLRKKILRLEDVETSLRFQLTEAHYDNNTKKTPSEKIENLKKDKDANFKDIENKIQFYRDENAKIIIDRSEIQKKLENAKSRLLINEENKRELKLALDKLNQILESSNIQTIF